MFFCHFYPEITFCDFLCASLDNIALSNGVCFYRKKYGPRSLKSKFFPLRIGQCLENGRVASPESVSIQALNKREYLVIIKEYFLFILHKNLCCDPSSKSSL